MLTNQKGLTLIELLAVIVILGIIAAIAIPSIGNIIDNSKYGAIKSDAIMLINAANMYKAETGELPANGSLVKEYIEGEASSFTLTDITSVKFTEESKGIAITGTGKDDATSPSVTVSFTAATITEINAAPKKYTAYTALTTPTIGAVEE